MTETFNKFRSAFRAEPGSAERPSPMPSNPLIDENRDLRKLLDDLGGKVLNSGVYRLFDGRLFDAASEFIAAAFPDWYGELAPIACDWMGRIFAVDGSKRRVSGQRSLCLLDPATRDNLQVPASVTAFHNEMLVSDPELPLEYALWKEWLRKHPNGLAYEEVAGWQRPAFLGGQLVLANLEIQPARVYWDISGQLIVQAFKLKPGTHIRSVEIR